MNSEDGSTNPETDSPKSKAPEAKESQNKSDSKARAPEEAVKPESSPTLKEGPKMKRVKDEVQQTDESNVDPITDENFIHGGEDTEKPPPLKPPEDSSKKKRKKKVKKPVDLSKAEEDSSEPNQSKASTRNFS